MIDRTNAKRSSASRDKSARIMLPFPFDAGHLRQDDEEISVRLRAGLMSSIACLIIVRLDHERAHSRKEFIPSMHSLSALTKHCSAFSVSAVNRRDSRKRPCISSLNISRKSAAVAYPTAFLFENCILRMAFTPCADWPAWG